MWAATLEGPELGNAQLGAQCSVREGLQEGAREGGLDAGQVKGQGPFQGVRKMGLQVLREPRLPCKGTHSAVLLYLQEARRLEDSGHTLPHPCLCWAGAGRASGERGESEMELSPSTGLPLLPGPKPRKDPRQALSPP